MNLNLTVGQSKIDIARMPELGKDSEAYFSPEVCVERGTILASAATTGEYKSSGGSAIFAGGRNLVCRVTSPNARGIPPTVAGLTVTDHPMTVSLNVTFEGGDTGVVTATFDVPTYTDAKNLNLFPMGVCADFIADEELLLNKKIKEIVSLDGITNMTPGNKFQILTVPPKASFSFISCTDGTDGKFNLPKVVEIACGANASAFTRLGRTESNMLSVKFKDRGALEQLNRFNGSRGTMRVDVVKDGLVTAARYLYSGYYVMASTERGSGDDEVIATSEGPYENFLIGYPRIKD